jgi:alanyl-tRNA synthetase
MGSPKTSADVRAAFLDFFQGKGHQAVKSSPIIPTNDPTLMFTNAGMVQFKDVFTGREQRPYKRACSSQKCLRISGKHNDLENVGRTARHHTFFEMLGNFSFGDYFKEDAIAFAWELLTSVLQIPRERMVVTVFGGDGGIGADDEARVIWRKVTGFGDERIIGLGMADNFWSMGDVGPCGPCSEIYFYHGDNPDPARLTDEPGADGSGWVEIWNLVFMQFERTIESGSPVLKALPAPSIDTGAGLERVAGAVSGHRSNYDTDLLRSLVEKAGAIAGKRYGASMSDDDVSMRVIADHARAAAFLISEGLMPDRTGREYVLRRVMRRAIRHGHRLGIERPFLHEVALEVVALMGGHYGELVERKDLIATVTEQEETRFRQTIDRGLKILDEEFVQMREKSAEVLDGACAFRLYDTFGFPLDLTEVICRERGLSVDLAGYEKALEEARARSEYKGKGHAVEQVYREAQALVSGGEVRFVGYERESAEAKIVAILRGGEIVTTAASGDAVEIVLDKTPFYGESGGQIGDHGVIRGSGFEIAISDTQKPVSGLVVHVGEVTSGEVSVGATASAEIDRARRDGTRRSHSATHLLHYALRRVLGEHAQQKGSLVEPDRLRFDFTSGRSITAEEKAKIEDLVNEKILQNAPIETEVLPVDEAKKRGAMAIFEEKYGDVVRVLTMTADSVELCGGTHARATGDIGLFKMTSEASIAAGVRRIEAVTGFSAVAHVRSLESTLAQAASLLRAGGAEVIGKIEKLVNKERELEKKVSDLSRKLATGEGGGASGIEALVGRVRDVGGVNVIGVTVDIADRAAQRDLAEKLRDKIGEGVVLVASKAEGKVSLVLTVSKGLTSRLRAGDLIRPIAQAVGGSGGGRPDMAQAGGADVAKIDEAVESLYGLVQAAIDAGGRQQPS